MQMRCNNNKAYQYVQDFQMSFHIMLTTHLKRDENEREKVWVIETNGNRTQSVFI